MTSPHAFRPAPGSRISRQSHGHEVSGERLRPLGIQPEQFPFLVELWSSDADVTRASLTQPQEMDGRDVESMLLWLAADQLIEVVALGDDEKIVLSADAIAARDAAIVAARRANQAAATALSADEMAQLVGLMNRVVDALQASKTR